MRFNYKRIGQYVHQVSNRNVQLAVTDLKGISISKQFMPSVANINGTDLSKYKVVAKYQFAYNPMHVGRDEVLPIGILESNEPVIVSPAYVVFAISDTEALLPEYLMMWCRRSEFDRNAWFTTDSSVRGGFNWDDFCGMTLPIPTIDKQREIVREYNTIVERIKLNEQLNQKLEEAAQALYKHWFVDFEFPISKEYADSIGKPELEGKPYKASGGGSDFDENPNFGLPKGWRQGKLSEITEAIFSGGTPSTGVEIYWGNEHYWLSSGETREKIIIDSERMITQKGVDNSSTKLIRKGDSVMATAGQGKTRGQTSMCRVDAYINQSMLCIRPRENKFEAFIFITLSTRYHELRNESDAQAIRGSLNKDNLSSLPIIIATKEVSSKFQELSGVFVDKMYRNRCMAKYLEKLRSVLLARMVVSN